MKSFPFAVISTASLLSPIAYSNDTSIETIEVTSHHMHLHGDETLTSQLADKGLNFSNAGGVSALPVMNGMMGDRIQLLTDGAPITAACGNQMNPPLSYVSANQVSQLSVFPGVSPVSAGGDNIAGVIALSTLSPGFSDSGDFSLQSANVGYAYQSNDNGKTLSLDALVANNSWYLRYAGTRTEADSYEDGHGELVLDTLYKSTNHVLTSGYQDDKQRVQLSLSHQSIPYQGFPNQYMDMTDNNSTGFTTLYQRDIGDITLDATLSLRHTTHEMGFFTPEKTGMMPMNTDSHDYTAKLQWTLPIENGGQLLLGQEWYKNTLDDWWPAIEGSAMMGPNDYVNINDGRRQRTAVFAEWSSAEDKTWHYQAGLRVEHVTTDTGDVQAYADSMALDDGMSMGGMSGMMMDNNVEAAMMFNEAERSQSDTLADVTLLASRTLPDDQKLIFGLARKNRAPNLYERYSWGTSAMATSMIGWFGDGNGYIGKIDLKPETAHTVSVTYQKSGSDWAADISVWYTDVKDYIDVEIAGSINRGEGMSGQRNILAFTNTDAQLHGATLKTSKRLVDSASGNITLYNTFTWQQGKRQHGEGDLYQILPVQNTMSLAYAKESFTGSVDWQWVGNKNDVDQRRLENTTDAYSLINLKSSYQWETVTLHFDINNLLDAWYEEPLGGVSIAQYNMTPENGFSQLAGRGRSFDVGLTLAF